MKVLLVILGVVVVAAIAVVAGCRMLASRSTEATVALTAKLPTRQLGRRFLAAKNAKNTKKRAYFLIIPLLSHLW